MNENGSFEKPRAKKEAVQLEAGPERLLAIGDFKRLRDLAGMRGEPDEMFTFLNSARSMHAVYQHGDRALYPPEDQLNPLARLYFMTDPGTTAFYTALFEIAKGAGFSESDRPAIERYLQSIEEETEDTYGPFGGMGSEEQRRSEEIAKQVTNALIALESVFPLPKTQIA